MEQGKGQTHVYWEVNGGYIFAEATDLANDKLVLVTERLALGNQKPTIHLNNVVTHASSLATHCSVSHRFMISERIQELPFP